MGFSISATVIMVWENRNYGCLPNRIPLTIAKPMKFKNNHHLFGKKHTQYQLTLARHLLWFFDGIVLRVC